jgi:hypothetical protein
MMSVEARGGWELMRGSRIRRYHRGNTNLKRPTLAGIGRLLTTKEKAPRLRSGTFRREHIIIESRVRARRTK